MESVAGTRFKDLCIDARDAVVLGRFWAELLGLELHRQRGGDTYLTGPTPQHTIWINRVPEAKTVKHRMHLDVRATVERCRSLGAVVIDTSHPWTVMADPEGGELCVFDEAFDAAHGPLRNIVVDSPDPQRLSTWWAEILGGEVAHHDGGSMVTGLDGVPFDSLDVVPVAEAKTVKNRLHIDVTCSAVQPLVDAGATLLRARDATISWTVLADPDGNEFCAFEQR